VKQYYAKITEIAM